MITSWDWSTPKHYMHDAVSTDKRKPTVNANGRIYGSPEESTDNVPWLDPVTHTAGVVKHPYRDPKPPSSTGLPLGPSAYWAEEPIWDGHTSNHNPMIDEKGRVWFASRVRAHANPDYCKEGGDHPSAKVAPLKESPRHLSMYDPKSDKWTLISTCFPTHHLYFGHDKNNTLWTSAGQPWSGVVGWLDVAKFEETGDEAKAQGWTPIIIDTNGNGKRDAYVGPNDPVDPTKDKRINAAFYGVQPSPADDSIWGQSMDVGFTRVDQPGYILRLGAGRRSGEHVADRDLPVAGRHMGLARPRSDERRRGVDAAGQRPHRKLRPAQVQGSAERPAGCDRQAVPGRLDALPHARPAVQRRGREGQREPRVLSVGRPLQHARPRQGRADRAGERRRVAARGGRRQAGRHPRAVPARLLHQERRRTHRRSERAAGRARDCGPRRARAPSSTTKAARRTARRSTRCRCGPIRSRADA